MSKISEMQGVPAHLEILKSDGKRRNISRCRYSVHKGKHLYLCDCISSGYYKKECHSCAHCVYYKEKGGNLK